MGALDNITWKSLSDDLWLRARRNAIPISGTFELTPLCNFRCRMCYVRLDPDKLIQFGKIHGADEWLDIARQASKLGTYRITLTGGEPLIHPEFMDIYSGLSRMGMLVSIFTNGSLISDKHIKLFTELPPLRIRVTLYGSSNATYSRLCHVEDGFDKVNNACKLLADNGLLSGFAFTETVENVEDYDDVLEIARSYNVPITVTSDLNSAVRGAVSESEKLRLSVSNRRLPENNIFTQREPVNPALQEAKERGLLDGPFSNCRSYRTSFFIAWNGYMETCPTISYCQSKPFLDGFEYAWEDMLSKLSFLKYPDTCINCKYLAFCSACPGKRASETGSPIGISLRHCKEAMIDYHNHQNN